jgi:hypothetical protein
MTDIEAPKHNIYHNVIVVLKVLDAMLLRMQARHLSNIRLLNSCH